jgi:hypothetical protein
MAVAKKIHFRDGKQELLIRTAKAPRTPRKGGKREL